MAAEVVAVTRGVVQMLEARAADMEGAEAVVAATTQM